jgi:hypothetical protein
VFVVDSGMVLAAGDAAAEQLAWLATALGVSRAP